MKRLCTMVVLLLSSLMTVAAVFMWARSHTVADRIEFEREGWTIYCYSVNGNISIGWGSTTRMYPAPFAWWSFGRKDGDYWIMLGQFDVWSDLTHNPWQYVTTLNPALTLRLTGWRGVDLPGLQIRLGYDDGTRFHWGVYPERIAWWWLVVLCGMPLWITFAVRGRHRLRIMLRRRGGRCLACGYDLRGSEGKCPECGAQRQPSRAPSPALDRPVISRKQTCDQS